ncbi:MAG: response regulator [Phycisphaerae bacterium]
MNTRPRILVVDDNPTNRVLLTRPLENAGYEVRTADDGVEAVDAVLTWLPDLVLLDMVMPKRDGIEVCRMLKARENTRSIPVIFVTAMAESDQILKAFQAGGCDYITRPFRSDEVLARISTHVRLRRAELELRERNKQLEELTAELRTLSRMDPLTRLLNRRVWEETVEREHERFMRHGNPYSIVMIDVDHFKAYNDHNGHQQGDECLRHIADSVASVCRHLDSVGRYGGEEFVILAPETQGESAVRLAERARKSVWMLGIPHFAGRGSGRVTISAGVATGKSDSWEAVLKEADDALYLAKKAGRNMVYSADGTSAVDLANATTARRGSSDLQDARTRGLGKVLVIDDEKTNRLLCKACLERAGYEVYQASDGRLGIDSVRDNTPDVIIMDVMMPNMDGLECTRRLKADPDTRDIPIIMISARTENEDVLAGLEAGADEYLAKPIRTMELCLRVRSMARLRRERMDLIISNEVRGEHTRILTGLVDFCRAVATSRRREDVIRHTLTAVADVARSRRVSIMCLDPDEQRLKIVSAVGMDEELASTVLVPVGEPIAGKVFASGQPIVMNSEADALRDWRGYDSRFFASVPLLCTPMGASEQVVGVLNVTERVGGRPFTTFELEYVELIATVAATAIHDITAREAHNHASDSIMVALAKLAEHRDNDTGRHVDRVTRYCVLLAEELRKIDRYTDRIDEAFLHDLVRSVPLHDIGKVAIPDRILLCPRRLKPDQMEVMRTHAEVGAKTIRALIERSPGVSFLVMAADIAYYHHERYDGTGYPLGLRGDAIPLAAQITALADVYDALTSHRVYKDAVSHEEAVAVITQASGSHFAPAIVEAFTRCEKEFAALAQALADQPRPASSSPQCGREDTDAAFTSANTA